MASFFYICKEKVAWICQALGGTRNMESIILQVQGMTCGHCAKTVERHARDVPGVEDAKVDLQRATLTARGGTREALVAAVRAAGYDVR